jgi:carboxymethylenebutenolidase
MAIIEEVLDLQVPEGTMATCTYRPDDNEQHPAVIVIQEIFGVNTHIKDVARRIAEQGYVTAAPDLFHRTGRLNTIPYDQMQDAAKLREGMTDDGIVADLDALVRHLQQDATVLGDRIGITGYCMGGRVSFLAACRVNDINAAAVYYGGGIVPRDDAPQTPNPAPIDLAAQINCPLIGFFGGQDQGIPIEHVQRIEDTLNRLKKDGEIHIYPEAGHGFFNNERPNYNEGAARDAWAQTIGFFDWYLRGANKGAHVRAI